MYNYTRSSEMKTTSQSGKKNVSLLTTDKHKACNRHSLATSSGVLCVMHPNRTKANLNRNKFYIASHCSQQSITVGKWCPLLLALWAAMSVMSLTCVKMSTEDAIFSSLLTAWGGPIVTKNMQLQYTALEYNIFHKPRMACCPNK